MIVTTSLIWPLAGLYRSPPIGDNFCMDGIFNVKVESDLSKMFWQLGAVDSTQWPGLLAEAANETGFYVINKYKQQMPSFIDRPTSWTLNSMYLKKASSKNVEASVQWREFSGSGSGTSAGKYLQPEVFGGNRHQKRFEKALEAAGLMPKGYVAIPTAQAPRDGFGNVPGSFIVAVLSYLKANPDYASNRQVAKLSKMSTKNLVKGIFKTAVNFDKVKAREQNAQAKKKKYFAIIKGKNGATLPSGIYERRAFASGSGIQRIFIFEPYAKYKVSFPFEKIGADAARDKFPDKLTAAIAKAIYKTQGQG